MLQFDHCRLKGSRFEVRKEAPFDFAQDRFFIKRKNPRNKVGDFWLFGALERT